MSNIQNVSVTAGQPAANLQAGVTEAELKSKSTGRRVTLEDVNDAIHSEHFFRGGDAAYPGWNAVPTVSFDPLQCLTFCVLVLTNGYTVTGQSACADPNNYNQEIGQRIAREDAVKKIWPLLGFALREEMAREQDLLSKRAFTELADFGVFIGTKVVHATPMSRAVYNDFRGWTMPANEEDDEGYLVEYTDGGQANVEGFAGYISWSPKTVFEKAYRAVGQGASASAATPGREGEGACEAGAQKETTFIDRLKIERAELAERLEKLNSFLNSNRAAFLTRQDNELMETQSRYMSGYLNTLDARLARLN